MTIIEVLGLIGTVFGIFTITIILTRIFGLRTFAKMSSFDFASTIAVGSVLAAIILNADYSLLKGGIILTTIIGFQMLFSFTTRKFKICDSLFKNKPQIIMWQGEILFDQLKKCNVGEEALIAKLREANVHDFKEVNAVILESTGDVSVLHNNENKKLNSQLLKGVNTNNVST